MFALSAFVVAALMEPYSAIVHRVLWHGPLWRVHRHHHRPSSSRGLGPNDALSASHAPIAIALCAAGFFTDGAASSILLGAGFGMTAYGALYALFHDGMVHGRLPVAFLLRFRVCRAWRDVHEQHHAGAAAPWGFFLSPLLTVRSHWRGAFAARRRERQALGTDARRCDGRRRTRSPHRDSQRRADAAPRREHIKAPLRPP